METLFEDPVNRKLLSIRDELFPETVKTFLATNIYVACAISKEFRDSMINIPMRGAWIAGHTLAHFIDKLITEQIDNSEIGRFPYDYREIRIPKCGYPYMEYYSSKGKFHIKKADKEKKLPKAAIQRYSNSLSNAVLLNFGPEYNEGIAVPFALITFGHNRFELSFVELGFPKSDYSDWAGSWNITGNISKELAEEILEVKGPELKEEYQEEITQKFELKVKGD